MQSARPLVVSLATVVALSTTIACEATVDCESLCARTLACDVEFTAPDDPDGDKVASGERSELESCVLGCEVSPLVTLESASCVDGLDTSDPATCQGEVLDCLGASEEGDLD